MMRRMEPVVACVVMESEGPWVKPEITKRVDRPNSFYVTFRTVLQTFNKWNRNGREYMTEAMVPALNAPHLVELRRKKSWVGQNGHPTQTTPQAVMNIDPTLICHKIDSIDVQGNTLYGQITTLDDDMWGKQMTKHILQGMEVAFSLRALANIVKVDKRRGIVKTPPHIVTYDRVILPSHMEAYQDTSSGIKLHTSGGEAKNVVQESYVKEIAENEVRSFLMESVGNFVTEESERVKEIVKVFDVCYESVGFSNDGRSVFIKDTNTGYTYNIALEAYVENQISDVFRKFH